MHPLNIVCTLLGLKSNKKRAVAKKADRTACDVRYSRHILQQNRAAENATPGIVMVTWPRCRWLFQTRKFRWFGFSLCCGWTIHHRAKCLKKWIGSALLGTRRYNFQPSTSTRSATIHNVTDGQTDRIESETRRKYHDNSRAYCVSSTDYNRLKIIYSL